jgi:hypothetical protein
VPATLNNNDAPAAELGVKFQSSVTGTISAIRFYKSPQDTGTHVGSLWKSDGTLMARATFTNETASGWQQVSFAAPVSIAANTLYIASYHFASGFYPADDTYFSTTSHTSGQLTAPSTTAVSGGNGVYTYGAAPAFPTQNYMGSNYWVDIVFNPNAPAASPPQPTALTFQSVTGTVIDNASAGTVLATAVVAMSDGSQFRGTLTTSDTTFFAISGMNIVTARALTSADDGAHSTTITAQQGAQAISTEFVL